MGVHSVPAIVPPAGTAIPSGCPALPGPAHQAVPRPRGAAFFVPEGDRS